MNTKEETLLKEKKQIESIDNESNKSLSDKKDYDLSWLKGTSADQTVKTNQINKSAPNIKTDFSDPVYKKLSRINGKINSMSIDNLVKNLKELKIETTGKKEVLMRRLKNFHKEKALNKTVETDYDYVCVIDFEATCRENTLDFPHEIIEFPIVLVNMKTLAIEKHFQSYCKPRLNPKLTAFCKSLTGITQDQVDKAEEFPNVLNTVSDWFLTHNLGETNSFAIATDGPWDMQKFLRMQCDTSNVEYPAWAKEWIDVRKLFSNWFGVRRCGILKMLDYIGFEFEGNQHCGLDDSRNIARILLRLASDGCKIRTNAKIKHSDQEN